MSRELDPEIEEQMELSRAAFLSLMASMGVQGIRSETFLAVCHGLIIALMVKQFGRHATLGVIANCAEGLDQIKDPAPDWAAHPPAGSA